jgi:hypothetical protein
MKLITTIFISLVLISTGWSNGYGLSGEAVGGAILIIAGEVALVVGGISNLSGNINYLNGNDLEKPSVAGGIILGTINAGLGALILSSEPAEESKWVTTIAISQLVIGVTGIATSIAVENKSLNINPAVLYDSVKKPVTGINLNLRF